MTKQSSLSPHCLFLLEDYCLECQLKSFRYELIKILLNTRPNSGMDVHRLHLLRGV